MNLELKILQSKVTSCEKCNLANERDFLPVFGSGKWNEPDLAFFGQNPGAIEDKEGTPFSGPAGKELDKIIHLVGYTRESVWTDNVARCHSFNNRPPTVSECDICNPFTSQVIELIKPKIIICVGKPSARNILGLTGPMWKMVDNWYEYKDIPTKVIYHPAAYLHAGRGTERSNEIKWNIRNNMENVLEKLSELKGQEGMVS